MLRIETSQTTATFVTYKVSGQLTSEQLPAIRELIAEAAAGGRQARLDLSELTLIDRSVVDFFCRGVGAAVDLVACPSYLNSWLSGEGRETTR